MTYEQELQLMCDKIDGFSDLSWAEVADELDYEYNTDTLRKSMAGQYGGKAVYEYFKNKSYNNPSEKDDIIKERIKLQDENRQYRENLRKQARNETINENIIKAIKNLPDIPFTPYKHTYNDNSRIGLLSMGDAHYGKEFELTGVWGETINAYSPLIFKQRMMQIENEIINSYKILPIDRLVIVDVGDCVEGILRCNDQLQKLKKGIFDSAIEYAEFVSLWLNDLQKELNIPIEYHLSGGNHDAMRILSEKANFADENVAKLINEFIKLRVSNNENIIIASYSDVVYAKIYNTTFFAYHGEDKNLEEVIEFFENYYSIDIDVLLAGHLHHNEQKSIGYGIFGDREIIRLPSICGTDTFAKKVRKASNAGALYMTINNDGIEYRKNIILY